MILNDYELIFIVSSVFGSYILYKFMNVFFKERKTNKRIEFLSYVLYFIFSCTLYLLVNIPIINMVGTILVFFFISLNYKSTIKSRLIAVFLIYIILLLIELLIGFVFGFVDFNIYSSNIHFKSIMGLSILKVVTYFVVIVLGKYKNIKKNEKMPVTFWFALIFMPIGTICIILFLLQTDVLSSTQLIIGISIMLAMSIITFTLYDSINIMLKNKIESIELKQQRRYYIRQYKLMEETVKKTNSLQHDLKKHFQVLEDLAANSENTRIISYIKEISGSYSSRKAIARTGNIPIDSIINFKLSEIEKKNINVYLELAVPVEACVSDFDLAIILGNLIDNAIEAVSKLESNRYIKIKIMYKKEVLFITVENSYDGNVLYENNKIITLRKNKEEHGFGLENIRNSIEKYNGLMKIKHINNIFTVDILLYKKTDNKE